VTDRRVATKCSTSAVEHSNSGKKVSIRFDSPSDKFAACTYSNSSDGEFGKGPGGVSLRCGSFCAISVSIRQSQTIKLKTSLKY